MASDGAPLRLTVKGVIGVAERRRDGKWLRLGGVSPRAAAAYRQRGREPRPRAEAGRRGRLRAGGVGPRAAAAYRQRGSGTAPPSRGGTSWTAARRCRRPACRCFVRRCLTTADLPCGRAALALGRPAQPAALSPCAPTRERQAAGMAAPLCVPATRWRCHSRLGNRHGRYSLRLSGRALAAEPLGVGTDSAGRSGTTRLVASSMTCGGRVL